MKRVKKETAILTRFNWYKDSTQRTEGATL